MTKKKDANEVVHYVTFRQRGGEAEIIDEAVGWNARMALVREYMEAFRGAGVVSSTSKPAKRLLTDWNN